MKKQTTDTGNNVDRSHKGAKEPDVESTYSRIGYDTGFENSQN